MSENQTFEQIFGDILVDYFNTFATGNPVIPDYKIVEDISSAYIELRPDVLQKNSISAETLSKYNGFAIPPKKIDGVFTVLINKNVIMENIENKRMDWVGTIAHETTHVQDFSKYAQIIGASNYDIVLSVKSNGMFNLWTEINARAKGYYFVRKYTLGEAIDSLELVSDIINREIPLQQQLLFEKYHATDNGFEQAYLVAHYIGRLYTLQQLYPSEFTNEWILNHFGTNRWMYEWFCFYQKYHTLETAAEHFEEMKDILRMNFTGL